MLMAGVAAVDLALLQFNVTNAEQLVRAPRRDEK
jgi:hypothetical protein